MHSGNNFHKAVGELLMARVKCCSVHDECPLLLLEISARNVGPVAPSLEGIGVQRVSRIKNISLYI